MVISPNYHHNCSTQANELFSFTRFDPYFGCVLHIIRIQIKSCDVLKNVCTFPHSAMAVMVNSR